jgi:hypothetical protein
MYRFSRFRSNHRFTSLSRGIIPLTFVFLLIEFIDEFVYVMGLLLFGPLCLLAFVPRPATNHRW